MTNPDPRVRRLVEEALAQAKPSPEMRARSKVALLERLQGPPPPPGADASPDPGPVPAKTATTATLAKAAAVVLAVGGLGAVAAKAARSSPAPVVETARDDAPPVAEVPATRVSNAPSVIESAVQPSPAGVASVAPKPAPRPRAATAPPTPAAKQPPSTISAEADLVARADAALSKGKVRASRTLLRNHRLQFPNGQLARERDALLRMVACRLGEPGAEKAARDFVERRPSDGAVERTKIECKLQPE